MIIYNVDAQLERPVSRGTWDEGGEYRKGAVVTSPIKINVQPLDGTMIKILPEGKRDTESLRIFTQEELLVGDTKAGITGDVLIYNQKRYDVWRVLYWILDGISHYESIVFREDK